MRSDFVGRKIHSRFPNDKCPGALYFFIPSTAFVLTLWLFILSALVIYLIFPSGFGACYRSSCWVWKLWISLHNDCQDLLYLPPLMKVYMERRWQTVQVIVCRHPVRSHTRGLMSISTKWVFGVLIFLSSYATRGGFTSSDAFSNTEITLISSVGMYQSLSIWLLWASGRQYKFSNSLCFHIFNNFCRWQG